MDTQHLFEDELKRRGIGFSIDAESGRHSLNIGGTRILISLTNIERGLATDGDIGRIARFVDSVVESTTATSLSADRIYWNLEPNDYEESADYRVPVSDRVDRVLVHLSSDGRLIRWVTPDMLESMGLTEADAGSKAFLSLAKALRESTIEAQEIDAVQLGYISTSLPFKASLILAPNLREVVASGIGWPILAVAPDRDFLYFWAARHTDFAGRVESVVVREYLEAAYPISTEVYEISDYEFKAIGEFPTPVPQAPR